MSEPFTPEHFEKWASSLVLDNGQKWKLEPFQLDFVGDIFQAKARENWLIVPEGNGKTTLLAGLGLYGLQFQEDAMIPIAASSMQQAKVLYRQAKGFIRRGNLNEARNGHWFEAFDGWRRVDYRRENPNDKRGITIGVMEVHGADSGTADGVIPAPFGFLDELHRHKNLELYETWLGKTKKRDAQIVIISTAGAPGSEFEDLREKIRAQGQVKKREQSYVKVEGPGLVFHEFAVAEDADTNDLDLVKAANPFSGITKKTLREKRASLTLSDSHWSRFTCNRAAMTDGELFLSASDLKKCLTPDEVEPGSSIGIGGDGSRTWDTTVIAWAAQDGGKIHADCRVFSVRANVPHHVLHQGGKIDFDDVEGFLIDLFDRYSPAASAYDPRYLERSMEIVDVRLPEAAIVAVEPQTKAARDAYQALYTAVVDGKLLLHDPSGVIQAHFANCAVDRDERTDEIRRLRKIDARKPIDAVPALALAVWAAQIEAADTSFLVVSG